MKIGHYAPRIGAQGGIATYIRRLGAAQVEAGHSVVYVGVDHERTGDLPEDAFQPLESPDGLFKLAECLELDVLHLHRSVPEIPSDRVLTVRTMHGHQAGCPSASRYLSRPGVPCDRPYTVGGCLWGHIVDRCGSVRPKELIGNFRRIHHQIAQVSKIPTYTVSQFLREKMIQAGCERANLETIASPAPPVKGEFTPVPDDPLPRFLYLGRLVPQKGLDWLLRAVAATPHALHLDVAGEGPERDALQALAEALRIESRVTFHGWVDSSDVGTMMQRARAVVFPSVWHEPAGLVSLEAAAHGRAVVASRSGGIPEYARPTFSTLVEPRDVDGLAEAIGNLARNRALANDMGRRGHEIARDVFSMTEFASRVEAWYVQQLRWQKNSTNRR